jgi:hypothetical protein
VKHFFQYLFTATILMVALMISHGQEKQFTNHLTGNPSTNHSGLVAELSSSQLPGFTIPSCCQNAGFLKKTLPDFHKDHKSADYEGDKTLLKTQFHIYLELKPVLKFQSGRDLYHNPGSDDPPLS